MYVDVIIRFISGKRVSFPKTGYRPDITVDGQTDYWGVTFIHLEVEEGPHSVAEGTIKLIHF